MLVLSVKRMAEQITEFWKKLCQHWFRYVPTVTLVVLGVGDDGCLRISGNFKELQGRSVKNKYTPTTYVKVKKLPRISLKCCAVWTKWTNKPVQLDQTELIVRPGTEPTVVARFTLINIIISAAVWANKTRNYLTPDTIVKPLLKL